MQLHACNSIKHVSNGMRLSQRYITGSYCCCVQAMCESRGHYALPMNVFHTCTFPGELLATEQGQIVELTVCISVCAVDFSPDLVNWRILNPSPRVGHWTVPSLVGYCVDMA